jgi:hypothetical protein
MDWSSIGLAILQFVLPILGTVLASLAIWALKKLLTKLGLDENAKIDSMIDHYVHVGVNHAEKAAQKVIDTKLKLSGGDKMNIAVSTVLKELEESGIKDVGEDLIKARIEAYLNLTPKVPAAPTTPTV